MATKRKLLNFLVDDSLLETIDEYRFRHRFTSRAAAIIWLLQWALAKNPRPGK